MTFDMTSLSHDLAPAPSQVVSRHSHQHAHNPMCLDDVIGELTELTLAGNLHWRRTGVSAWEAERVGFTLVLDDTWLYVIDEHGRSLGESHCCHELVDTVHAANTLADEPRSTALSRLVVAQSVLNDEAQAQREAARAKRAEQRAAEQRRRDAIWNSLR